MTHPQGMRKEQGRGGWQEDGVRGRGRKAEAGSLLRLFVFTDVQAAEGVEEQVCEDGARLEACHSRGGLAKALLGLWFVLSAVIIKTGISLKVDKGDLMF